VVYVKALEAGGFDVTLQLMLRSFRSTPAASCATA
jgi:hypothetical protein